MFRLLAAVLALTAVAGRAAPIHVVSPVSGPLVVSSRGLTTPGGIDALNQFLLALDAAHYVRQRQDNGQTSLEVLDTQGRTFSQRTLQGLEVLGVSTARGPCVSESRSAQDTQLTRCFGPDLKRVWQTIPGPLSFINRGGTVAYLAATPSRRDVVQISRLDLVTGHRSLWPISTRKEGDEPGIGGTHADLLAAFPFASFSASVHGELPGHRALVCLTFSLSRWGCRWSLHDTRTGQLLRTIAVAASEEQPDFLEISPQGHFLYAFGNTVRVWDAQSGRQVLSLHDPAWAAALGAGGFGPREVLFTPDERRMVVITAQERESSEVPRPYRAFVYAVPGGRRLTSFSMGTH